MPLLDSWDFAPICVLCGASQGLQHHHKVFRSRGGSDDPANLARLCVVCHGAVHGVRVTYHGHSCFTCPVLDRKGCFFGETVTGRSSPTGVPTPMPWDSRHESPESP